MGLLIPFIGTSLGAAVVFVMKKRVNTNVEKSLCGFAAGVMMAASVWSLLLPGIALCAEPAWAFAAIGFSAGIAFLVVTEHLAQKISRRGAGASAQERSLLAFAVTLHNIPEGMAVGVAFAAVSGGVKSASFAAAFALSLGIALQNIPEGAVISMPLRAKGGGRFSAFLHGAFSGAVEPLAAVLCLLLGSFMQRVLPLFLTFAAGAMVYVCVNELIPYSKIEGKLNAGALGFGAGFALMMILDVALG